VVTQLTEGLDVTEFAGELVPYLIGWGIGCITADNYHNVIFAGYCECIEFLPELVEIGCNPAVRESFVCKGSVVPIFDFVGSTAGDICVDITVCLLKFLEVAFCDVAVIENIFIDVFLFEVAIHRDPLGISPVVDQPFRDFGLTVEPFHNPCRH